MGIAFSIVGISLLVGAPLEGGLLRGESGTNYTWYRSIIFCGVCVPLISELDLILRLL